MRDSSVTVAPRAAGQLSGSNVRVHRVVRTNGPVPTVAAFAVDLPKAGAGSQRYGLELRGWVLGAKAPIDRIDLRSRGVVVGSVPVNVGRPDLGTAFPDFTWASSAGFRGCVNTLRVPSSFSLDIEVVADSTRRRIATVHGTRTRPCEIGPALLQPVVLTTLGRSGSTWVTRLLGQHPAICAYRPFACEPRAAAYWHSMVVELSETESFNQLLWAEAFDRGWWTGAAGPNQSQPRNEPIVEWLDETQAEQLLPFCIEQVQRFYRRAATAQQERDVSHFVEKTPFNSFLPQLLCDLYPQGVEVVLVRDFRDMVVSMLGYNRRREMRGFGRDRVASDEEFIRWWRGGAAAVVDEWKARSDTAFLLRYEDLIRRPVDTLTSLLDFVGVDSGRELVEGVLERSLALTPEAQRFHMTSGDAGSSIGRWTRELSDSQRALAREAFDDLLAELGYEL